MAGGRKIPPVWALGFAFAPMGIGGAVTLVALPQLLSADNVPEAMIATITAAALAPGFAAFVFGPLLDWRLKRKSYAVGFVLLGAIGLFAALLSKGNLAALVFWEFFAQLMITVGLNAVGGWFSTLIPQEKAGALGAWFTAWNIGAGGFTAIFAVNLIRATSLAFGAAVLAVWAAAAVLLLLYLPCRAADGRLAHESIRAFARDTFTSIRSPRVLWSLLLFVSPAASFALTNIAGGLGRDFATSEQLVGLLIGGGAMIAGIFGSLAMPVMEKKVPLRHLYLYIGLLGAAGTLFVLVLPREPTTFALAILGENLSQAAAFAVVYGLALRTVGENNPLAATQFSLLSSAMCLPLTYMQVIDAQGYALGQVTGAFVMDAAVSGSASLILLGVLWRWRKSLPAL
jgi:PAT family beta-lactamase induction signal transducer AmpG